MVRIVFLLGRPGSGKSYIAQRIHEFAQKQGWTTRHIYDYQLLQEMFEKEIRNEVSDEERSFRPRGPQIFHGFDVVNFSVLDEVLETMANEVRKNSSSTPEENRLFLVEFARNNYGRALHKFGADNLKGAFLFYINAEMGTCQERINQRVKDGSPFGHFVSDEIMQGYYSNDDWLDGRLKEYLEVLEHDGLHVQVEEIDNMVPGDVLNYKVEELVRTRLISELAMV